MFIEQIQGQKDQMKKDLENAGDYLLEIEQKCNKANKTALELLN